MAFTNYTPDSHTTSQLVGSVLASTAGFNVDLSSVQLHYGVVVDYPGGGSSVDRTSLSFYDGSLNLGIGAGLLLTSGNGVVPTTNSDHDFGGSFASASTLTGPDSPDTPTDTELQNAVEAAFSGAGSVRDYTSLAFTFTVTDPSVKGIRFDLVFGSDEYPEYKDSSYVDIAAVFVNGTNYALFNQQQTQPLSIISQNLAAGNFIDNSAGQRSIEYDGVSAKLEIVASVVQGVNTIKFAIGDTGDSNLDSGLFIANMAATNLQGFGLAEVVPVQGATAPVTDKNGNQIYQMNDAFTTLLLSSGDDIVQGSQTGIDYLKFAYSVGDLLGGSLSNGILTLQGPSGSTVMENVDKVAIGNQLFALDTQKGEATWEAMALLNSVLGSTGNAQLLAQWSAAAEDTATFDALASSFLNFYFPSGLPTETLVSHLFTTLLGAAPTTEQLDSLVGSIGSGKSFSNNAAFLSYAAQLDVNTNDLVQLTGSIVGLDFQTYESHL